MTIKEQIKILSNKIRQNKADYDLYRKSTEVSALSSGKLNKYEYLTNNDLGYSQVLLRKQRLNTVLWVRHLIKG